jgi:hypothetical protein
LAAALLDMHLPDGLCPSFISTHAEGSENARPCASIFPTALTLSALAHAGAPEIHQQFSNVCIPTLRAQAGPHGSWNYWKRGSLDAAMTPYPDDLDTTCCVLTALSEGHALSQDGKTLARAVTLLMANETMPGGPYRTWLVPPTADAAWQDVDPAVNANIGRFLHTQDVTLDGLVAYAGTCLTHGTPRSPYYPSDIPTLYFLSSWYRGPAMEAGRNRLTALQKSDGSWGTPVETAMAVTALIRWGITSLEVTRGVDILLATPPEQILKPFALCVNIRRPDCTEYLGSPAASAALCLEALAMIGDASVSVSTATVAETSQPPTLSDTRHAAVIHQVEARITELPVSLQPVLTDTLTRVAHAPTGRQVTLLPFLIAEAFPRDARASLTDTTLSHLATAALWGWMGYTLGDDLIDHETDARALPAINTCIRILTDLFLHALPPNEAFRLLFHRVMDGMEEANAWELAHWRLSPCPDGFFVPHPLSERSDILAARSFGHALPAITLLCHLGHDANSPSMKHLWDFFTHALIARQLDDDMHDWEEDLHNGQVSRVGADLLNAWMIHEKTDVLRIDRLPAIRTFFWETRAQNICALILSHADQAEKALRAIPAFEHPTPLLGLLATPRASATRALQEQERMSAFLATYIQERDS